MQNKHKEAYKCARTVYISATSYTKHYRLFLRMVSTFLFLLSAFQEIFNGTPTSTTHPDQTDHIKSINPLNTKSRLLYLKAQFVPHNKHFSSRF